MEVKKCLSLLCAAEEMKSQGLLHVEKQDEMRILAAQIQQVWYSFFGKTNMPLPNVSNPNHKTIVLKF